MGPFVYREYPTWSEPEEWDEEYTVPGEAYTRKAVKMTFNTDLKLQEDRT